MKWLKFNLPTLLMFILLKENSVTCSRNLFCESCLVTVCLKVILEGIVVKDRIINNHVKLTKRLWANEFLRIGIWLIFLIIWMEGSWQKVSEKWKSLSSFLNLLNLEISIAKQVAKHWNKLKEHFGIYLWLIQAISKSSKPTWFFEP